MKRFQISQDLAWQLLDGLAGFVSQVGEERAVFLWSEEAVTLAMRLLQEMEEDLKQ